MFARMQRKEYADIEIVLTEKKGYGLRAASDIVKLVVLPYLITRQPVSLNKLSLIVALIMQRRLCLRVHRRRRQSTVLRQADARLCGRGYPTFLLHDVAEG